MKIFNPFKKKEKVIKETFVNWISLNSLEQLKVIKEQSKTETILIFKHSTRCGISKMVIKQFEKLFDDNSKNLKVYYLDLLNYRNISNQISQTFQVIHQSPQLLIVNNERITLHLSHYEITQIDLKKYI